MSVLVLEGHVLDVLASLEPGSVHCAVTSPPYLWLRSYGTPPQMWGGDPECEHDWDEYREEWNNRHAAAVAQGLEQGAGIGHTATPQMYKTGAFCARCGAWRGELGQEPTPELYIAHLVACFRAVRRVLRDDGTLWVNLSGCFYNDPGGQNGGAGNTPDYGAGRVSQKVMDANRENGRRKRGRHPWLKPLDWVDLPGLFARAMQQDGWLWRSDVVWVKPSPLPESVQGTRFERCRVKVAPSRRATDPRKAHGSDGVNTAHGAVAIVSGANGGVFDSRSEWADCPGCPKCAQTDGYVLRRGSGRPTKSYERVLLFVKKPGYFYDLEAVREPPGPDKGPREFGRKDPAAYGLEGLPGNMRPGVTWENDGVGRNLRDVWTLSPEPLKMLHYAAYPSELPSRAIRAGTSEWGCCPACGAPWARVIDTRQEAKCRNVSPDKYSGGADGEVSGKWTAAYAEQTRAVSTTLGWRPTCRCPEQPPVPAVILDPFAGSGTTLLAANRLGRDAIGIELKGQYVALAKKRVGREPLSLFATHGEAGEPVAAG